MIILGLLLSFISGFVLLACLSSSLRLVERLGLSFPIGIFTQSFLMVCLDWVGIKLTASSVLMTTLLLLVLLFVFLHIKGRTKSIWSIQKFQYPPLNLAWFTLWGLLIAVMVMNVAKTLYFPTFDTDSVRGFNLIGKAIAHEGNIRHLSIFTNECYSNMKNAGSYITYMPLTQLSYAYVYLLGAQTSKIINALFFVSFVFAFYGVLRRFVTPLSGILFTLLCVLTPEMLAFSSLSGTNFIHAIYASLGVIYFVAWHQKADSSLLWISAVLLMGNIWTRNEGLVFIAAVGAVLLYRTIKDKQYKRLLIYGALCLFPFVFYHIFLKVHHLESTSVMILKPFYDGDKLSVIFNEMWQLFTSAQFYGITFVLFVTAVLADVLTVRKQKDNLVVLLLILTAWFVYTLLIYQVNYLWDSLENVMRYSYKRFLFSFVPILWLYIANNHYVRNGFEAVDRFIFRRLK